jgi:glucose-6-phosphate dehydrogenase assembly protein OpcA
LSAAPQPARVLARADQELRALWAAPPAEGQAPKTRASTMNLVVVAPAPSLHAPWVAIVDQVLQGVPARAIVVGLDPDGADNIEVTVSPVCPPGAGNVVCSERVTLSLHGGLCGRVASCVDALCAADVPTTLVWLARVRVEDPTFAPLARWSHRIVLEATSGSLASLAHVVKWARGRPAGERPGISELAWTRLAPWQELCARMFDDARLRELALGVSRVRLVQASASGAELGPEGALLLGWLATRLGWKASSFAGKLRMLRGDGGPVQVQLHAETAAEMAPDALLAVEIEARGGDVSLRGQIARARGEDGAGSWQLEIQTGSDTQRVEQRVRTFDDQPARILQRTLRRRVHDDALAESVLWADEIGDDELVCS